MPAPCGRHFPANTTMAFVLSLIFFLSGAAALIFETLWFREAGIAFGNSVWGAALVMAGFMAGLAMGNWGVARYGERIQRPIRLYALLEIVIAAAGVALIVLLPRLALWLGPLFGPFLDVPYVLNPLRLGLSFLLLVIPTTAMGATLPMLVKALRQQHGSFGWALGRLYGWNTLGAVGGVVVAELFLIGWLGVLGTGRAAALLDLIAALLALRLDKTAGAAGATEAESAPEGLSPDGSVGMRRLLGAAAVFGFVMLSLEVVWFRFLLLVRDGTSLIFALMLAITLAGISIGGLLGSLWCRRSPSAHRRLPELSLLSGIVVVVTYRSFEWSFHALGGLTHQTIPMFVLVTMQLALPVAMLSGILFTLLGQRLRRIVGSDTRAAGLLTLANTLGAAAGSLFAGFVLLPRLGMEHSFFLCALAYGIGSALVLRPRVRQGDLRRVVFGAAVCAFAACMVLFPFGLMKRAYYGITEQRFRMVENSKIVAVKEGLTETVFYLRKDRFGEPYSYRLVTNGFGMASTSTYARRYMKLFVYWPVAVHPDPKTALLISYGMGSTAKALTDTKSLSHIDIVDISRDILDMSSIVYPDPAGHPLHDPRVEVHIEDGRFFLQTTAQRYDIITAEPPPPNLAGVVNLYSQEYFQLIHDQLESGGIATYWLPNHLLTEEDSLAVTKAFCNVFDDCSLWEGTVSDWMLVGTRGLDGAVSRESFSRQWKDPKVARELQALGIEAPEQLGALFIAEGRQLDILKDWLPLTDDFPQRVGARQKAFSERYSPLFAELLDEEGMRSRFRQSELIKAIWPPEIVEGTLSYFPFQRTFKVVNDPLYARAEDFWWEHLDAILTHTSLRSLALWMLGSNQDEQDIIDRLDVKALTGAAVQFALASRAIADRDYDTAAECLETYLNASDAEYRAQALRRYVYVLCLAGRRGEAERAAKRYAGSAPDELFDSVYRAWVRRRFGVHLSAGAPGAGEGDAARLPRTEQPGLSAMTQHGPEAPLIPLFSSVGAQSLAWMR